MGEMTDAHEYCSIPELKSAWDPRKWVPIYNKRALAEMDLQNNAQGRDCAGAASFHWEERFGGVIRVKVYNNPHGDCVRCCERKAYDNQLTWLNGKDLGKRPKPEPVIIRAPR